LIAVIADIARNRENWSPPAPIDSKGLSGLQVMVGILVPPITCDDGDVDDY